MRAYIIRRLLLIIPTLFLLTIMVFLSVRFIPGDIIDAMMGKQEFVSNRIDRAALERMLGLDVPVHVQYGRWLGVLPIPDASTGESYFRGILQGALGESLLGALPVEEQILARLPVTIELGVMAILIGLMIALPVGIYSAIRQDTAADYVGRSAAILGLATPNFWLAIMVVLYPSLWWRWTPPIEWVPFTGDPWAHLGILVIPSLILATALSASTMRMTRTMMLEVLRQDYVRTAWAKGLRERVIVMRHAVKNALIPVVSLIGLQLPILIGGSVIMENIFNLPGLGRLMLTALEDRDYPVVSGVNLFFATAVVLFNLLVDLLYSYLDPRVRYE
ncbi:MAG: ABC transporter permease [Spirochaetaceae bacterium]|nr:ABC transporter permease [Spirochaetaceae bacterium]